MKRKQREIWRTSRAVRHSDIHEAARRVIADVWSVVATPAGSHDGRFSGAVIDTRHAGDRDWQGIEELLAARDRHSLAGEAVVARRVLPPRENRERRRAA